VPVDLLLGALADVLDVDDTHETVLLDNLACWFIQQLYAGNSQAVVQVGRQAGGINMYCVPREGVILAPQFEGGDT
jgi:hypothetical protein